MKQPCPGGLIPSRYELGAHELLRGLIPSYTIVGLNLWGNSLPQETQVKAYCLKLGATFTAKEASSKAVCMWLQSAQPGPGGWWRA